MNTSCPITLHFNSYFEGQFQGAAENKLFVASMNKQATAQEIHEVSPFILVVGLLMLPLEEFDIRYTLFPNIR